MDYEEIMRQAEIVNWVFIIGTGIFTILIMAAIITFIRWLWKKGN